MARAKRLTAESLKKVGITLEDTQRILLRCDVCGRGWSPLLWPGGKLSVRYWWCPQGCNRPQESTSQSA